MPGETDFKLDPAPDHGESSYVGNGRLAGLATLVTGADSGIGRAVALAFAREGADVVVSYLEADADADETIRLVETEGRRAIRGRVATSATSSSPARSSSRPVTSSAASMSSSTTPPTSSGATPSPTSPTDEWERTLRTNLTGMFFLCREAVPHMEPGASIINTASIQAQNPSASLLAYADHQGRHRHVLQGAVRGVHRQGHPGQRGGTGPGVDAARRGDVGSGDNSTFGQARRSAGPPSPPSSRRRSSTSPPPFELRHRRDDRRDGWRVLQLAAIRPARGPRRRPRRRARR